MNEYLKYKLVIFDYIKCIDLINFYFKLFHIFLNLFIKSSKEFYSTSYLFIYCYYYNYYYYGSSLTTSIPHSFS